MIIARFIAYVADITFTWLLMYLICLYWGVLPFSYSKQVDKEWVNIFINEWEEGKREKATPFLRGIIDSYINGVKRDWISYSIMYDFLDTLLIEEEVNDEY